MIVNFCVNGIKIEPEYEHWKLSKDGYTIRCDGGEINEAIPEFLNWISEKKQAAVLFLYKKRRMKKRQ